MTLTKLRGQPIIDELSAGNADIRQSLVRMSEATLHSVDIAVESFLLNDSRAAHEVLDQDRVIDVLEVRNDTLIYQHIALHRPEEAALRFLLSSQKVNTILERIGDHAVNIAEACIALINPPDADLLSELRQMATRARAMLADAQESFFGNDAAMAESVLPRDAEVDAGNKRMSEMVREQVFAHALTLDDALEIIRVSKNLERIADLSTNIAEEAVFAAQGRSIKHRGLAQNLTDAQAGNL